MLTLANALRVVAISSVMICGLFDTALLSWVPLAAILLGAIAGVKANRYDAVRLNEVAEQTYFIGYVSTISAFAAAILNIYKQGRIPESPNTLLLLGGIALLTTVGGLLFMTAIKELAANLPRHATAAPDLNEFLEALKTLAKAAELATATRSLAEFIETKEVLLKDLVGATSEANAVRTALSSLTSKITETATVFGEVSASADLSRRDIHEIGQVLDKFVASLSVRLNGRGAAHGV